MGWSLLTAGLLSGCADAPPAPVSTRHEVSAPKSQKASIFDQARSAQNLANARMLLDAGDAAQARGFAEAAVNDWPDSVEAWAELQAVCQALADKICRQHADFFHDKVVDQQGLPARVAVLGLQNLIEDYDPDEAAAKPKKKKDDDKDRQSDQRIDDWTFAMAQRMMAFYDRQDKLAGLRDAPVPHLVTDDYPPSTIAGTMLGIGAAGFAVSKIK
jgi:hypothetical protein